MNLGNGIRPSTLPEQVHAYRAIGPFDGSTLPAGLRRTHDLAEDVWGVVSLEEGNIAFVWEDAGGERVELVAPAELVVPPRIPHHVEAGRNFRLSITFYRA